MREFAGKVAVVLGATSGIGIAVAEKFAEEGARVVVVGRNEERGGTVVRSIAEAGGEAQFVRCDITSEADIINLMDDTVKAYGRIDILIGNAGIPESKVPLHEMADRDFADFMAVINTDLIVIIQSNRYAIRHMLGNEGPERGVIVNVSSILGVVADYETASYPASKAG